MDFRLRNHCFELAEKDINEAFGEDLVEKDSNWNIMLQVLICTRFYCRYIPIPSSAAPANTSNVDDLTISSKSTSRATNSQEENNEALNQMKKRKIS